jgi:hypothetical protein
MNDVVSFRILRVTSWFFWKKSPSPEGIGEASEKMTLALPVALAELLPM